MGTVRIRERSTAAAAEGHRVRGYFDEWMHIKNNMIFNYFVLNLKFARDVNMKM